VNIFVDAACYEEGHLWRGTGACVRCGEQLRCYCGRYVTEAGIDKHLRESCPVSFAEMQEERRSIESTFAP
jgi:hypothetical protein